MSESVDNNSIKKRKKLRTLMCGILILIIFLILAAIACTMLFGFEKDLKQSAYDLKDDLKAALVCLKQQDADGAERMTDAMEEDLARMDELLASPIGRLARKTKLVKTEMDVIDEVSMIVRDSTDGLLKPYIAFMRENPLSALKTESGSVNYALLKSYSDFIEQKSPDLKLFAAELEELSAMPYGRLESRLGGMRGDMDTAQSLIPFVIDFNEQLLRPCVEFIMDHPLSRLKTDDGGIDLTLARSYLDFANENIPLIQSTLEKIDELGFGENEKLLPYRDKIEKAMNLYEETLKYQPLVRAFIGEGEDRLYVFAAQNSSEIRASGGFPGSIGTIRIRNNVLYIEDFHPVNDVLFFYELKESGISDKETRIFGGWFLAPRDADFCPDYERVAEIWAAAYREKCGERVDGVLSATPAIIQRFLSVVGEIELSDGTILDGTNATRMLEYDMYYRYFSNGSNLTEGNTISDNLFAETAKKVISMAMSDLSPSRAAAFLSVMESSAADRTLMLWMAREDEQEIVRGVGLDGGLNRDPARPEAGIYFSLTNPSRMGWFLDMDPSAELVRENEDGSKTYAIHLDMRNMMTEQELRAASYYIAGSGTRGVITGYLYLFAPAGGTIGEIDCSFRNAFFQADDYHGLDLLYTHQIWLTPGSALTVDYTVTTAPCEQEALAFSMTPTLQAYR